MLARKMVPKWIPNRLKLRLFRRLWLDVFFSGLESLLKLIFASTAGPANPYLEGTLRHFLKFFRFAEDRVENDFEMIFDLPKAPKNLPKSPKTGSKNSKEIISKKNTI